MILAAKRTVQNFCSRRAICAEMSEFDYEKAGKGTQDNVDKTPPTRGPSSPLDQATASSNF
jgi:hypothetical protein